MSSHLPSIPTADTNLDLDRSDRLTRPFARFARLGSAGGLLLIACTAIAMVLANSSAADTYHHIIHETSLAISVGDWAIDAHLGHWINDALMAVFFLLVGLEIKREILVGELASPKRAALPIAAAIGGMVVPGAIYAAFNTGSDSMRGWGVPMATDIAFALGILALLGSRVPTSLKVFLASLAIVDDLGALLVIAIFYTDQIQWAYLGAAGGILALLFYLNFMGFRRSIYFIIPGIVMWYCMLQSGVHATIAGVLLAMTIPASTRVDSQRYLRSSRAALDAFERSAKPGHDVKTNSSQRACVTAINANGRLVLPLLHRMEYALVPWVAYCIIPIFALANAGLHIHGSIGESLAGPISIGVIVGLVVGKPVGIVAACFIATKLGIAALPKGVSWRHIIGVGCLGGVGFTMALFIGNLAFPDAASIDHAKIGILAGSSISAILGLAVLLTCKPQPEPEPDTTGPLVDSH